MNDLVATIDVQISASTSRSASNLKPSLSTVSSGSTTTSKSPSSAGLLPSSPPLSPEHPPPPASPPPLPPLPRPSSGSMTKITGSPAPPAPPSPPLPQHPRFSNSASFTCPSGMSTRRLPLPPPLPPPPPSSSASSTTSTGSSQPQLAPSVASTDDDVYRTLTAVGRPPRAHAPPSGLGLGLGAPLAPSSTTATTTTTTTNGTRPSFLNDSQARVAACTLPKSRCSCMNVVIIGAGLAGVSVATSLAKRLGPHTSTTITLIDPRNYVEIRWAVIRALFDPTVATLCTIPLADGLARYPAIRHVRARATRMSRGAVALDNGAVLPFNVCLLATGSVPDYALMSAPADCVRKRREELLAEGRRLCQAPSVLIVGGGPVGAELAGHLAVHARQRRRAPQITLMHHGRQIAEPLSARAGDRLADQLRGLGIDVVLGETAEFRESSQQWVVRSTGRVLAAAEVVTPTGVHAAPGGAGDLLRGLGLVDEEEAVDEKGWVRIDKFGRVGKFVSPNNTIFAIGDCTSTSYKSGVAAIANRKNMAHNVHVAVEACIAARRGQEYYVERKLKVISPPSTTSVAVIAGPSAGVVQTRFFMDDILLPALRTRTTLSLSKVRNDLGL